MFHREIAGRKQEIGKMKCVGIMRRLALCRAAPTLRYLVNVLAAMPHRYATRSQISAAVGIAKRDTRCRDRGVGRIMPA